MSLASTQMINAQEMTFSPQATRFALTNLRAEDARVNIYKEGVGGSPIATYTLKKDPVTNTWSTIIEDKLKNKFYTFQIKLNGEWRAESPGIDAKAVGLNGQRGAIIDMRETNPSGWDGEQKSLPAFHGMQNAVIYEMHHRDFSIDASSGVANRGKFVSLTQGGTKNASGLATGIDHLKELGVTHVHLLPSYDFGSIDEATGLAVGGGGRDQVSSYNWGYDPVNYNVPEGSYSTDPANPTSRIVEFKSMVMALHRAGIRVVMDVVYNHVFDHDQSQFNKLYPGQFFRYKEKDGKKVPANGSGCGNETASDGQMMRQYMVESVKYWMTEYHIDGFRFDLMGIHDIETMNAIREAAQAINPNVIIYGEGWAAESPAYPSEKLAMKANTAMLGGIAAFGDEMRDGLRGGWQDDKEGAFLIGKAGNEESVKFGIVGGIQHDGIDYTKVNYSKVPWATQPSQMISYVSCHDDMCLADRIKCTLEAKANGRKVKDADQKAERIRLQKLAETVVLTSQGVPFIWCGDEIMRDKKGVHNSYASPDSINQISWDNKTEYKEVFEYVKSLIALRKSHKSFRMGDADVVRSNLDFLPLAKGVKNVIAYHINGAAVGDSWNDVLVILNSNQKSITQAIPEGKYTVVCSDGKINLDGLATTNGKKVVVAAQSALIMYK